jgi:ASC-1-like (ASCH) protein
MLTDKQKKIVSELESLVGQRFSEERLNETLSKMFNEQIKVENVSQSRIDNGEEDDLADFNLMFNSEQEETYGYFDIYMLPMRKAGFDGSTMYITEISYEFE